MEDNYVSTKPKPKRRSLKIPALVAAVAAVLSITSFYGGIAYQKHHTKTVAANGNNMMGRFAMGDGANFSGTRPTVGTVTAISSGSISVQNSRTNTVTTFTVTSSTTITDNGSSAAIGDIKTGDTVLVQADSSNTKQAASIVINPSFGGGMDTTVTPDSGGSI